MTLEGEKEDGQSTCPTFAFHLSSLSYLACKRFLSDRSKPCCLLSTTRSSKHFFFVKEPYGVLVFTPISCGRQRATSSTKKSLGKKSLLLLPSSRLSSSFSRSPLFPSEPFYSPSCVGEVTLGNPTPLSPLSLFSSPPLPLVKISISARLALVLPVCSPSRSALPHSPPCWAEIWSCLSTSSLPPPSTRPGFRSGCLLVSDVCAPPSSFLIKQKLLSSVKQMKKETLCSSFSTF